MKPPTVALEARPPVDSDPGWAGSPVSPDAVVAAARQRQRRRRTRLLVFGLVAFAMGAGLWLTIGPPGKGLAVGAIEARELAALHSPAGLILFERKQPDLRNLQPLPPGFSVSRCMGCGLTKTWINFATGGRRDLYYSPGGRLVGQNTEALLRNGQFASGQVNYRTQTWSESSISLPSAKARRQVARSLSPLNETNLPGSGSSGGLTFRLIGRQTIDGQLTLHLRGTLARPAQSARPPAARPKPAGGTRHANGVYFAVRPTGTRGGPRFELWLNARTYLPVREQVRGPSGRVQSTTTYKWLSRTSSSLAELKLKVPPGFADQLAGKRSSTP
jgi:hypothetical protein